MTQYPVIPAVGNASTIAPIIGNFSTALQVTGQTPLGSQYPVIPAVGNTSAIMAPIIGNFFTTLQATGQTPVGAQYPVIPAVGNAAIRAPTIGNLSTVPGKNPTLTQHPMVATVGNTQRKGSGLEKRPTVAISQATAKSSTMGQPIKVFLKISSAGGKTQSVYQVLSPSEFRVPPVVGKNSLGVPAGKTAALGKVPETILAPAVVTSSEKNPTLINSPAGVSSKAPAVYPPVRTDPTVVSPQALAVFPVARKDPAVVSAEAPAVSPIRKDPELVSSEGTVDFSAEKRSSRSFSRRSSSISTRRNSISSNYSSGRSSLEQ